MSCPGPDRIAAAAAGGDDALARHAATCARCAAALDEQIAMRALLDGLAPVRLAPARQATLAAEVLARADRPAPRRRGALYAGVAAAAVVAIAASAAMAVGRSAARKEPIGAVLRATAPMAAPEAVAVPDSGSGSVPVPDSGSGSVPDLGSGSVPDSVPDAVAVAGSGTTSAALVAARGAHYRREAIADRDVVTLTAGTIKLAAGAHTRPVDVRVGAAAVAFTDAEVEIATRGGAIATVTVFAGSAEIAIGVRRITIEAGATWHNPDRASIAAAPADRVDDTAPDRFDDLDDTAPDRAGDLATDDATDDARAPAPLDPAEAALADFRAGWRALRRGHDADAVAAFDRATEPVIAEDAAYWAAVATARLADRPGAERRFRAFLLHFPDSPHADAARAAIARPYSIQSPRP